MTLECKCVDEEQRKLLLQAVGELIVSTRNSIDIWKTEKKFEKIKDVAIPHYEEKVNELFRLERRIKDIPTCTPGNPFLARQIRRVATMKEKKD